MLFQEVIRVAEGIPAEGLRAALSQALDAVAEPPRGRRHVLQPTVRRLRHNHLHAHGVANLQLVVAAVAVAGGGLPALIAD